MHQISCVSLKRPRDLRITDKCFEAKTKKNSQKTSCTHITHKWTYENHVINDVYLVRATMKKEQQNLLLSSDRDRKKEWNENNVKIGWIAKLFGFEYK